MENQETQRPDDEQYFKKTLENKDFPAFPNEIYKEFADDFNSGFAANKGINPTGLSKREYFAIHILSNIASVPNTGITQQGLVTKAIELADELGIQLYK